MRPSITVLRSKMLRERYEVFMYMGIDVSNRSAMEYPTQHRRSTRHTRVKAQVTHGFSSQDRSFGGLGWGGERGERGEGAGERRRRGVEAGRDGIRKWVRIGLLCAYYRCGCPRA